MADEKQQPNLPSEEDLKWAMGILSKKDEIQDIINKKNEIFDSSRYMAEAIEAFKRQVGEAGKQAGAIAEFHAKAEANNSAVQKLSSTATQAKADIDTATQTLETNDIKFKELNKAFDEWRATAEKLSTGQIETNENKYKNLFAEIEGLLPGATSAGLAKSFYDRRLMYRWPRIFWLIGFLASLIGILVFAYIYHGEFLSAGSLSGVGLVFLKRLPYIGPLLWLAWFTSTHFGQATKVEEDYAYKEALSNAYQGFRRALKDISDGDSTFLKSLMKILLDNLNKSPGRYYDSNYHPPHPLDSIFPSPSEGVKSEEPVQPPAKATQPPK